ncbi:MAG: 16S rRNA pseudouridine(516) synthase, partial [Thermotogota bacterium]|nr:16S rRNA pseudouridine(516) synthase [Thermotogota bacterium]
TQGDLIHSIISPSKDITKTYIANVIHFKTESIQSFLEGMTISDDFITKPVTHLRVLEEKNEITTLSIGITEGKFHQVKKMFQFVQAKVIDLKRVAIGSLELDPYLECGDYKELAPNEIRLIFQ